MWKWILGTVRPIALLAGIPVLIGALIAKAPIKWDILYAMFAVMLGVGFANSFNSIVDRYIDRLNPNKKTLASRKPKNAWYGVLFLLPVLAFCLRSNSYNHCLFAALYYLCFLYSYSFGRIRIVKRVAVAAIIALTAILYVKTFSLTLWLFMATAFVYFFVRESKKDYDDRKEDEAMKFAWKGKNKFDLWCMSAPFLAAGIYLECLLLSGYSLGMAEAVVAFGIGISVWSYVQIRYRYQQYRMHLIHQTTGGRLGLVIALVGLMPSFVNPVFILVVLVNTSSIAYRSFLNKKIVHSKMAIAHDSYLWASLPLLVMTKTGFQPVLLATSVTLAGIVFLHEKKRLSFNMTAS